MLKYHVCVFTTVVGVLSNCTAHAVPSEYSRYGPRQEIFTCVRYRSTGYWYLVPTLPVATVVPRHKI